MPELPEWVRDAAALPLRFAQAREDARQDVELVRGLPTPSSVLLVASGGCTAAALSALPSVGRLHLVDGNPSQVALARLKLRLRERAEPSERLAILGHAALPAAERAWRLEQELSALELELDILGPQDVVARLGPDYVGRYERALGALRARLDPEPWEALLSEEGLAAQARRAAGLEPELRSACAEVFAPEHLAALFGAGATQDEARPFAEQLFERTQSVLRSLPAATNPYLWQMLVGRYPAAARVPWLDLRAGPSSPEVTWDARPMNEALAEVAPGSFGYVHLSNILAGLALEEAALTLERARRALAPGGRLIVRQLNSTLDVRAAGAEVGIAWEEGLSERLHARDRSVFCRALHVGRMA